MAEKFQACSVDDCNTNAHWTVKGSRGMCRRHYQRFMTHGDPLKEPYRAPDGRTCTVDGCAKPLDKVGLCGMHRWRMSKHGDLNYKRFSKMEWLEGHADYIGDDCITWPFEVDRITGRGTVGSGRYGRSAPRVMCTLAHGKPPTPKHEASHNCGKGHQGCINPRHLRWDTRQGNMDDMLAHGTRLFGSRAVNSKLTENDVLEIRRLGRTVSTKVLKERYGVTSTTINNIRARKIWAWLEG